MIDEDIERILERVKKHGMAITKSGPRTRKIGQKTDYIVYNNRKLGESTIIDKKKFNLFR